MNDLVIPSGCYKGFRVSIPMKDQANLETRNETMSVFYHDGLNDLAIAQTYSIDEAVKTGWMRADALDPSPEVVRVSLFRFKKPYRYIDPHELERIRKRWFPLLAEKILHKKREWLPQPVPPLTARLHESVEL